MARLADKLHCTGCSACFAICPRDAISMQRDNEGFVYPKIDENACINCCLCEKICPSIHISAHGIPLSVYAAKSKNDALRLESSSGGVFSLLAYNVLNSGGLVFGASFDSSDWHVSHECIDNESELGRLRGSKYVQSDMNNCFRRVKKSLNDGREVLFSGTPCQIAGLKSYLSQTCKSDMSKLLCVDVVCHAVPSPIAWRKYLEKRIRENCNKQTTSLEAIKRIASRHKYCGWKRFSMFLSFANDMEYRNVFRDDSFMRGFLQELYNRPSCHNCGFKNLSSGADITLGDYWGIESWCPEMDDDKGVSLVFVNTGKGAEVFDSLSDKLEKKVSGFEDAIKRNQAVVKSSSPHRNRKRFFSQVNKCKDFDMLVEQMLKLPMRTRFRIFAGKCLRKLGIHR